MKGIFKLSMFLMVAAFIFSCKPSGEKAETSEAGEVAEATGTEYTVNATDSQLMWEGAKPTGKHHGTVGIQSGTLVMTDGKISAGEFTIDMTSINVQDLEGDQKGYLESHLKGTAEDKATDFFNVNKYPTAKFEITKATTLLNNEDANYIINGNLTLKDTTHQISFKAQVEEANNMINVSTPQFTIDRTKWGIKYGSGKFFEDLGDKTISDDMGIKVMLKAKA